MQKSVAVVSKFFKQLLSHRPTARVSWEAFHAVLSRVYNEWSDALERHLSDDKLLHLLALLLVPIARSGLRNGERREKLFDLAEQMGVHLFPVHYYTPIPEIRSLSDRPWHQEFRATPGWDLRESAQLAMLAELGRFAAELEHVPTEPTDGRFSWVNPAIAPTDAALYYAMIRHYRPRQVVEVGSGYSTLLAADACLKSGVEEFVCVDPYPLAFLKKGIAGVTRLLPNPVQDVSLATFESLRPNDILFIDSTHISKIDSDVNYLLLHVVPRLAPGVIVHFHDIFLPWEYPKSWVKEKHIFWNEQYLLLAFLLFNTAYEILLATQYLGREHPGEIKKAFPFIEVPGGGSFWIRRAQ